MESLDTALSAARSIVVLYVPWSGCACTAVVNAEAMRARLDGLGITLAVVDEEAPAVRRWLKQTGIEQLSGDHPDGAGTMLWLERGSVVDVVPGCLTLYELLVRARKRWRA